jgi:methionine-gamma-lyase
MREPIPWWDAWRATKLNYVRHGEKQVAEDRFRTIAVSATLPPIHQSSTFAFGNVHEGASRFVGASLGNERHHARIYTRLGNPTTEHLEQMLLRLEAQHVIDRVQEERLAELPLDALIFSSGMGAISCLLFSLLRHGDAVVAGSVYGCTDSLLRSLARFGVEAVFCDVSDPAAVESVLDTRDDVRMVFIETPSNPALQVADIEALSRITEARGVPLVVDNTFASPYLQQPFRLGADFVIHSLTKYVNGHSMSVGGAVLGPKVHIAGELFGWYKDLGATPSPFDAWINSAMLQSLAVRQQRQCDTAEGIAKFLEGHAAVAKVHYPGLDSFPQANVVKRQMRNGGAMVAFELQGGFAAGERLMNYFARKDVPVELAVSLGAVISYVQHPASMTHAGVPEADRLRRGITPGLVRLSVGLESQDELIHYLDKGIR